MVILSGISERESEIVQKCVRFTMSESWAHGWGCRGRLPKSRFCLEKSLDRFPCLLRFTWLGVHLYQLSRLKTS